MIPLSSAPTPVAAWIRVSTEMQARDDRAGIPRQREAVERAAKAHNLNIVRTFVLEGVSGSITGRTAEWAEIRRMLDSGKIRGVVCDAVDRLCRASDLDLGVLTDLQRAGAAIYTPSEVRSLASSSDGLIAGILALVAGQEKREIVRRMVAGRESNRKKGRWTGDVARLPPGIHYNRETEEWSTTPEIETVIEQFRRVGSGTTSIHALSVESGIPNKTLRDRFQNSLYRGVLIHDTHILTDSTTGRRKRVKRTPDDVIKVQVFDNPPVPSRLTQAVDARMASNRRAYKVRKEIAGDDVHHLRGMLICASCGSPMSTVRRHRQYGYRCSSAIRQHRHDEPGRNVKPCSGREMPIEEVHLSVARMAFTKVGAEGWLEEALRMAIQKAGSDDKGEKLIKAKARLSGLVERRERLLDAYLSGLATKDQLERRQGLLERQIEATEREVDQLSASGDDRFEIASGVLANVIRPHTDAAKATTDDRVWVEQCAAMLRDIGARVVLRRPQGRGAPVEVYALHFNPTRLRELGSRAVRHQIGGSIG